jgi:histidinol-phosphate/aromatic aminotransferase/cobyric acid decarboxylase-like protein
MSRQILIRDCTAFVGLSAQFIRIAVRTPEEHERLLSGLKDVLN